MLEVRYNTDTKEITAWCGDEAQFGNLEREGHAVVILNIPIPSQEAGAYLFDEATQALIDNPDYIDPTPPDVIRAREILATSPSVITQPEMWELMRIFGRKLGFN